MAKNQRKQNDNVKTHPQIIDITLECVETSCNFVRQEVNLAKKIKRGKKEEKVRVHEETSSEDDDESAIHNNDSEANVSNCDKAKL